VLQPPQQGASAVAKQGASMKKTAGTSRNAPVNGHPPIQPKASHMDRLPDPAVPGRIRNLLQLRQLHTENSRSSRHIPLNCRVVIVEGISGSGKDGFQEYLKRELKDSAIYDYSEGEVLLSWNQLQIDGVHEIRIKLMKLFVEYVKTVLRRDRNAVFLLNRFHLSAYVMTVLNHPELEREYDEIVKLLKTLPVHVFLLAVDDDQIAERSAHPERSNRWRKFQDEIAREEGFLDVLGRYRWQQRMMFQAVKKQRISYSVVRFSDAVEQRGRIRLGHLAQESEPSFNSARKTVQS
jgi:thymidylate kinase